MGDSLGIISGLGLYSDKAQGHIFAESLGQIGLTGVEAIGMGRWGRAA